MGRRDGFRTICVVRSNASAASLAALGADAVIETDHQDLVAEVARVTDGRGVGYALDCVGGELTGDVVRCLGLDGRLVIYGTLADSPLQIPGRDLMMPVAHVSGFLLPNWMALQSPLKLLGVLRAVKRLTIEGVFHTEVTDTFRARAGCHRGRGGDQAGPDRQGHAAYLTLRTIVRGECERVDAAAADRPGDRGDPRQWNRVCALGDPHIALADHRQRDPDQQRLAVLVVGAGRERSWSPSGNRSASCRSNSGRCHSRFRSQGSSGDEAVP